VQTTKAQRKYCQSFFEEPGGLRVVLVDAVRSQMASGMHRIGQVAEDQKRLTDNLQSYSA
jgi:hypothetical protein